ncbi:serine/threonine-protein kinase [Streptomyces johnsoniae]|uniref:Serine/threonine-protein kinase n=1 Tax=Streptomyces johnsoniae TaxID=3075532 RepID=A0ABU2RXZ1_9ACTN|nr:serine/threonine-protein kinase [Streptomyces sp. DSM 41886]MDT0441612.1 serine/threonine-protein kinase [Streptomyces sp. DSM 41886]
MESLRPGDPSRVGPYRVLGRLGAGGMGQVFLGRSPNGRTAAVKLIHAELAEDPEFRRRFRREVAIAERVSGSWTAPVLGSDTESAVPWVATGYIPGPSLHEVVAAAHGPLPEESLWTLAAGLARALRDIHRVGLVHRDLKPSNVLVTLEGPKVIDFGIARAVDASLVTRTGSMIGSPGYMPPEQIRGEEVTGAVDVFALGAVLAFAATGTSPFVAGEPAVHTVLYRVLHEDPELGPDAGPLAGPLRALVQRCLVKDPAARPTVEELAEAAAARSADTAGPDGELWLPPALTARLGRQAASLLDLDGPVPTQVGGAAAPPPPASPPPAGLPTVTAVPPPPPGKAPARRALAVGAVAVAVALVSSLVMLLTRESGAENDPEAGEAPTDGSSAPQDTAPEDGEQTPADDQGGADAQAPLYDLLPPAIQESGEVTVRSGTYALPLMSPESADELTGFEPDLTAALGERLGIEFRFQRVDYGTLLGYLANSPDPSGIIAMTAMPSDATSQTETANLEFIPYFEESHVLMVPAGAAAGVGGFSDLCGRTVATWHSLEIEDAIARHSADCTTPVDISRHGTAEDLAEAVRTGEADALYVSHSAAIGPLQDAGGDELVITGDRLDAEPVGFAVTLADPPLRDALRQALQEMIDDGTYGALLDQWGMADMAVETAEVTTSGT